MVCKEALIKLVVGFLIADVPDFFLGWIPVYGTIVDVYATIVAVILWGPMGLIHSWEIVAVGPGNVADGFVPTCLIIGLAEIARDSDTACKLPMQR